MVSYFEQNATIASAPTPTPTPSTTPVVGPTAAPTNTPTPSPLRESDPPPRTLRPTRGHDDEHVESQILAINADADPPTIQIANRDGAVTLALLGEARHLVGQARVGDYLVSDDAMKHTEAAYDVYSADLERPR